MRERETALTLPMQDISLATFPTIFHHHRHHKHIHHHYSFAPEKDARNILVDLRGEGEKDQQILNNIIIAR